MIDVLSLFNKRKECEYLKLKDIKIGTLFTYCTNKSRYVFIKYADHIVKDSRTDPPNIIPLNGRSVGHHCVAYSDIDVIDICELNEEDIPFINCFHKKTASKFDENTLKEISEYIYRKYILEEKAKIPDIYFDIV